MKEFEKTLFKLIINTDFEKTMQSVRIHQVVKLVNKWGEGRYGAKN